MDDRVKTIVLENSIERENVLEEIEEALVATGNTDENVFAWLRYNIFESTSMSPDGTTFPNFWGRLWAIRIWADLMWYKKSWVSFEELLWIKKSKDRQTKVKTLLNKSWLSPIEVFTELDNIRKSAMKFVKVDGWYEMIKDISVRNSAIRFYSKMKDYMNDDAMNMMNFFKYDNSRVKKILDMKV